MQQPGPQTYVTKRGANHTLHIVLSVVTCGLWLPVWAIAAAMGRKTKTTVYPGPGYGPQRPPQQYGPAGGWQQPGPPPPPPGQYGPPRP
jgi:hypothetical protein